VAATRIRSMEIEPYKCRAGTTPEMVDVGLLTLASVGGRYRTAHKTLKEKGLTIPETTLQYWRLTQYPNRYRDIATRQAAQIEGEIVNNVRALALRASEAAYKALALEEERIESGETRDASGSLRNIATSIGISVDKILLMEGRPTTITEARSSDDVLRGLQDKGYVDSTAEDV
jgi:hypothetical protein